MTWTTEPRLFEAWNVETTGSQRRITEATSVRITEQGNIRIIERFPFSWTTESTTFNPWTKE